MFTEDVYVHLSRDIAQFNVMGEWGVGGVTSPVLHYVNAVPKLQSLKSRWARTLMFCSGLSLL